MSGAADPVVAVLSARLREWSAARAWLARARQEAGSSGGPSPMAVALRGADGYEALRAVYASQSYQEDRGRKIADRVDIACDRCFHLERQRESLLAALSDLGVADCVAAAVRGDSGSTEGVALLARRMHERADVLMRAVGVTAMEEAGAL